jgi:hypothetical protein
MRSQPHSVQQECTTFGSCVIRTLLTPETVTLHAISLLRCVHITRTRAGARQACARR